MAMEELEGKSKRLYTITTKYRVKQNKKDTKE